MIRAAYVQTMARYNVWENQQLTDAVQGLSQDVLDAERGAFFGSIFATMNHLFDLRHGLYPMFPLLIVQLFFPT